MTGRPFFDIRTLQSQTTILLCVAGIAVFAATSCNSDLSGGASLPNLEYARRITWQLQDTAVFRPLDFEVQGHFIFVADKGSNTVRKLNLRGQLLAVIGSEGEGPGEFREIRGLAIVPDGSRLAISDAGNARVTVFTTAGELVREFRVGNQKLGAIGFDQRGRLHIDGMGPVSRQSSGERSTISIYSSSGESIGEYGTFRPGSTLVANVYQNISRFDRANTDGMWILMPYRGTILRRLPSRDSTTVKFEVPRPPGDAFNGPFVEHIGEGIIAIARSKVARDITVDDEGRVYVLTVRVTDSPNTRFNILRVYDSEGRYVGWRRLQNEANFITIVEDTLYAMNLRTSPNGLPEIGVYALNKDS